MTGLPELTTTMAFDEASVAVVAFLKEQIPLGFWSVTRYDGERQLYLEVADDAYGLEAGGSHLWEDSFCVSMVSGAAPQIAPDAMSVPAYAAAGAAHNLDIGAYIGIPIRWADGRLFGTLCGLDPDKQSPDLVTQQPLLDLLGNLLSTILEADNARVETKRALELAALRSETDELTGLYNRRGWIRYLEHEDMRYKRFGDPGSVIVVDLDRLKEVNDSKGHAAGDRYIQLAAAALKDTVRSSDLVARLGGDEFGVIAAQTPLVETRALVDRIQAAFDRAGVGASIGHAAYTIVGGFVRAWEQADQQMYAAKMQRRGTRIGFLEHDDPLPGHAGSDEVSGAGS